MRFDQIVKFYGTQVAVAEALGIKQPTVSMWRTRGVPPLQQLRLQELTGGKLRAEKSALRGKVSRQ